MIAICRTPCGERHGRAKLRDAQVEAIRALAGRGMPYRAIAAMFSVGTNVVGRIVRWEIRTDINGVRALDVSLVR